MKAKEGKQKKEFIRALKGVSGGLAASFLLRMSTSTILCWLEKLDSSQICRLYFRFDQCTAKKCRHPHSSSISHLLGVPYGESNDHTERACCKPVLLQDVSPKDFHRILYLSVDGRLVFDATVPELWIEYWDEIQQEKNGSRIEGKKLVNNHENVVINCTEKMATVQISPFFVLTQRRDAQSVLDVILNFLNEKDLSQFSQLNRITKQLCLESRVFRSKRRDCASLIAQEDRRRKEEQKKRVKMSLKKNAKDEKISRRRR